MTFIDERLLDCVAYGTSGGPTFKTRKIPLRSGIVRRNPLRSRPLYVFNVLYKNLRPEDHAEVINAFNACYGGVYAFRIRDWADYTAELELLPVLGTGSPQSVQLVKTYPFGSQAVARPIRKPVISTVVLTANGTPIAKSIDANGVATFTATASAILRWSGEFDVPVMFRDDELQFSNENRNAAGLFLSADVGLEEDISQ